MVKSCNDLWSNPHFDLKIGSLILGILLNAFLIHPYEFFHYYGIVNGYHCSYLTVLTALIVAHIWFETNFITEVALLVVALIKLLVVIAIYADEHRPHYWIRETHPIEEQSLMHGKEPVNLYSDSPTTRFYVFLVVNIVCLIFIVIDIILRLVKK